MDSKDTNESLDDSERSPSVDGTVSDTGESAAGSTRLAGSHKKNAKREFSAIIVVETGESSSSKCKRRDEKKGQSEFSSGSEKVCGFKAQGTSMYKQKANYSIKKQAIRLHKKQLYSLSEKTIAVPIKKKTPIIIRDISEISVKEDDTEWSDNSESESRAIPSVRSNESSHSKTIIISQNPNLAEATESVQVVLDSYSESRVSDGSVSSKSKSNLLPQNQSARKRETVMPSASSSQASPYNTRFAHMKIGTVFPVSSRSSGVSRRKVDRENSKVLNDNASKHIASSIKCEESILEDVVPEIGVCFLCGISFTDDNGIALSVKKPLPLSKIDIVSLLESFSISCTSLKSQNRNFVNICNVCHTLIIEGDSSYKHFLSVASEMREQWPFRVMKKTPVYSLSIPDSPFDQFSTQESKTDGVLPKKSDSVNCEYKKPRGRPPKIKVKQEDDTDTNWRPSQIKVERTAHTGRRGRPPKRKIKREKRGRPRKIMIKGEISDDDVYTCGLCSKTFLEENGWGSHYEYVHRTQLRWVNYKLQKKLKKLLLWNIQEFFLNEDFIEMTCNACDSKFFEGNEFIEHLRHVHQMVVDDDFIDSLDRYSQGHIDNIDDMSESDTEKESGATSDGTVIKIEKDSLSTIEKLDRSVKCKVCHLMLGDEKALKEHTDTNHFSLIIIANDDSTEVVVPEGEKVSNRKRTDEELSEVTDKENIEDPEYTCEECCEEFGSRHKLLEHKLNIHGSNDDKGQEGGLVRYECEVCGRRIYGLAALKVHMTKVHYKTTSSFKFSCGMCLYKSQSRSQLGKHMRSKHDKEIMPSVQCETCGKMYGASYIAKHIATMHSTHTRNYGCNFCDMKFYDMAGLKFHIYHEHANKVWKCSKCPMEFKKYHQLRQHRIFIHSTKVHACIECPKTYKRKSDLTEHIKRLHLQRVVLLCPRCPKQYVNRFKLRNHLMKHHGVPWEDTLARNYARHQRANNCRRTEEGLLEANKDQLHGEDNSILIEESYNHFDNQGDMEEGSDPLEGNTEEHEYHFSRHKEEHEYHAHYRQSNDGVLQQRHQRSQQSASVKMERNDHPEEYIEIMEATDAFAKDGITYVIIEET